MVAESKHEGSDGKRISFCACTFAEVALFNILRAKKGNLDHP